MVKKKMNEKRKEKIYQAIVEKSRKQLQEGIKKYQSIDAFAKDLGNLKEEEWILFKFLLSRVEYEELRMCYERWNSFSEKIVRGRQNCNHETNK